MAKDPQKQPPTGDQPDAGGGADLPPWLRGDSEPSQNEAPASPPASASSLPRLSNRKDAPSPDDASADDESVPPWLRGLPPPEQKTFMVGGTEVSREFFDDAESIPETENSALTYDQWLANQIEDKREKSVEEELPDIFGTNIPTQSVHEPEGNRPQAGTPGVTGQLPDWFLGLEELDTADAPEWFKQMEAGNTGLLKEPPKPPSKEDKPPKWLNDETPPTSAKPAEPAAKKSDPIDDFFQSIGSSFDAPSSENWESESEVPGDDFFAELVGKKPAAPPPSVPQATNDFDVSNLELEADEDLPDLGWVTGPLSQSQFDLGEQAQTRNLFEDDAEQDASAPGLFNPRSGGVTMRFDTDDDDPPVGGATMRFDTDDDDLPVGGGTMRFDDDDDDLPFNAPSGGLTDLFEARKEGVTIRFDSDDYEDDPPTSTPAVEIPQYELDAFLEGLDDVAVNAAELAAIEDPDMDFIFTPPAAATPAVESGEAATTPTTAGTYNDSTLDWLSQIDSMVDSVTHALDPNTVGDRYQSPTGTPLPQTPEDDDFDFAPTADARTTRGGTSSDDDGFNWGDVASAALDPEPEAEGSDWLNDIESVDDTPYESATTPIDLNALGISSMLNRNRQPRPEDQPVQNAALVNKPDEDDLFNLTGLDPTAFGEQPAASEEVPYDGPTDWEQIVQSSRPLSEDDDDDFTSFVTADPTNRGSAAGSLQDDITHDNWLMDNLLEEADALSADADDWAASALSTEDAASDADFLTLIDRGSSTAQPLTSGYESSLNDDLFALAPHFDTDDLNTPASERANGEESDSAYPDFMFSDGGNTTDDDLFALITPQASAVSDGDDDDDLFSPVSSQLPDSGELPDFMFGDGGTNTDDDLFSLNAPQASSSNDDDDLFATLASDDDDLFSPVSSQLPDSGELPDFMFGNAGTNTDDDLFSLNAPQASSASDDDDLFSPVSSQLPDSGELPDFMFGNGGTNTDDDLFSLNAPQTFSASDDDDLFSLVSSQLPDSGELPDFMFGNEGTNTDDDLFSLNVPQASSASDDDDLFASLASDDDDLFSPVSSQLPDSGELPDFMFGNGGTNTDDDLFSLNAPQASSANDDDDLFSPVASQLPDSGELPDFMFGNESTNTDDDLFSPVASQLPDSGELPDFLLDNDEVDLFASPSAQPSYEAEGMPDFLRDSAPLASASTTADSGDLDDLFTMFDSDEVLTEWGDTTHPIAEPSLFDPYETQAIRGVIDDTAPSPDQDAAQADEAMQEDFFASLGLDMDEDTNPTQNVAVPDEELYGVDALFSSLNEPDPEPMTPDPEALAFGAGWDDSWGNEDTSDPTQSTGVTGLGAGLDWANEFADESDQQKRADQIQAFVENRPQEKPRSSNAVFEDIDDYLSSLDPTAPPISTQTGAAFSQTAPFDIDAMLNQEVPTERREAASPFTMSDGSSLESAQEDWLRQMGGSVTDMSAAAMVRQKQDRPVEELPERLRKLRERAEQIPSEADSAPNAALASVLPGVTSGLGSAAPFTTGAPAIDQNVAIPPEQQARIALLQSLAGVADAPERMTAIELTYDSPFMSDLEDDEENIVRTTTEERAVSVATVDRPRRRRLRVQVDRLVIAALLALAVFLPFVVPALRIGDAPPAAFAAGSLQAVAFAQVNALTRDDLVLLALEYQPGSAGELDGMTEAILRHILLRGASPVIISGNPLALLRSETQLATINADAEFIARLNVQQPLERNYEYFITRFLPGGIIGLRAFSQDTANLLTTDIRGQTTNLYINSIDEFDLVVVISDSGEILRNYAEQVAPYASAPFVAAASYGAAPLIEPYAQSEAMDGLWVGYGDSLTYAGLLDGVTAVRRGVRRVITPPPTAIPATPAPNAAGSAGVGAESTPESTSEATTDAGAASGGDTNNTSSGLFAVVSSGARVNVRSGAGTTFAVVTSVSPGTRLEVLGASEDTTWANIRLEDGSEGWISSQFLEIELPPTATPRNKPRRDRVPDVAKQEIDDTTATPAVSQFSRTPSPSRTPIPSRTTVPDASEAPEDTRTARPTVAATETSIDTATVAASRTATGTATATSTATATEVDADSTPEIVPTPAPLVFSDGLRQERWYGLQLGIIVSVLIISTGAVVNIGRGLFRRLRISRKRR